MHLDELIKKHGSVDIPDGVMGGAGIVLLLIAIQVAKGFWKLVFFALALVSLAGVVWWYFPKQGRI